MADEYQRGADVDWLKHSNEELSKQVKGLKRSNGGLKFLVLLLGLALGYVAFRYHEAEGIRTLWPF